MAEYKLVYVNYRGRAEVVRLILAQAGVQYEDFRIELEKWTEYRLGTPYGVVPILECAEGKSISGNTAISRYLGEKYDLAGSNALENAMVAQVMDVIEDLWVRMATFFWETDQKRKEEAKQNFKEQYLPPALMKLEKHAAENDSPEGWIYGSKVTYADFAIFVLFEALLSAEPTILDHFPTLAKLKASVEQLPNIKEWLQKRPKTKF